MHRRLSILFIFLFSFGVHAQALDLEKETFWERFKGYHTLMNSVVRGSLDSRGMSFTTFLEPNLASWSSVAQNIESKISLGRCQSIDCPGYENDFALVTSSDLTGSDKIEKLENLESFALRKKLIKGAKKSIYTLVWAIYDDETGEEFQNLLLESLFMNPDLDIRIIVDGNMAGMKGKKVLKRIKKLSNDRIKIVKWKSKKYHANGNHRKILVVDQEHVVLGGMNIGNNYSHMSTMDKWRDLDVYINGFAAGRKAQNLFIQTWNRHFEDKNKRKEQIPELRAINGYNFKAPLVYLDQHPGSANHPAYHNVHTGIVKLFRDAQLSIDIENAYFILDPIIRAELQQVIKRGVKVRIFTNSDKSVDEAIVSMPIMHSVRDLLIMGAEIYLRKGTTLHSKYLVVDEKISMIGSFNFHPRSLRFDAENVAVIFDKDYASELTQYFEKGISTALPYTHPEQFKIDWSFIGLITSVFYFDFL